MAVGSLNVVVAGAAAVTVGSTEVGCGAQLPEDQIITGDQLKMASGQTLTQKARELGVSLRNPTCGGRNLSGGRADRYRGASSDAPLQSNGEVLRCARAAAALGAVAARSGARLR